MSRGSNFKKSVKYNVLTFPYFMLLVVLILVLSYINKDSVEMLASLSEVQSLGADNQLYLILTHIFVTILFLLLNYFYTNYSKKRFKGAEQQKVLTVYRFVAFVIVGLNVLKVVSDLVTIYA